MLNDRLKSLLFRLLGVSALFFIGSVVYAAGGTASGIGGIATSVTNNLQGVAKLITAGSYVAGMAFAIAAIVKFKAHKDNPQQVTLGVPIVYLFVGIALIFIPAVFSSGGATLGLSAKSTVSGLTSF